MYPTMEEMLGGLVEPIKDVIEGIQDGIDAIWRSADFEAHDRGRQARARSDYLATLCSISFEKATGSEPGAVIFSVGESKWRKEAIVVRSWTRAGLD